MAQLVDAYFFHYNMFFPLLHRPTFDRDLQAGLHLTDECFGSIVLLVCAIGSKFSDDSTVLPEGIPHWHWAGWQWFDRVNSSRKLVHSYSPRLQDVQIYAVSTAILSWSMMSHPKIYSYLLSISDPLPLHRAGMRPSATVYGWRRTWVLIDGTLMHLLQMLKTSSRSALSGMLNSLML